MVVKLELVVHGVERMVHEGWKPHSNLQLRERHRERERREARTKPTKGERKEVGGW